MRTHLQVAGIVAVVVLLVLAGSTAFAQPASAVDAHEHASTTAGHIVRSGSGIDATHSSQYGSPVGAQFVKLGTLAVEPVRQRSYSRYDGSDPLENDVRAAVYSAIESSPGVYVARLSEETDVPRSTVRYHVRVLEREGLVKSAKHRGKHRFFPTHVDDVAVASAVHDDTTGAVLNALDQMGHASVSTLAAELELSAATVSYHLERLASDGVVVRERVDNEVVNSLSESAASVISQVEAVGD